METDAWVSKKHPFGPHYFLRAAHGILSGGLGTFWKAGDVGSQYLGYLHSYLGNVGRDIASRPRGEENGTLGFNRSSGNILPTGLLNCDRDTIPHATC